jgi:hypothetical protein
VEVLLGTALASLVVMIVWGLFGLSGRLFHSTRKRLVSLQGAFLLMERFNLDLAPAFINKSAPIHVGSDCKSLKFYYVDTEETDLMSTSPQTVLRSMEYTFDEQNNRFVRKDGQSRARSFKVARFEVILYSLPKQKTPPRPFDQTLTYRITCAALDDVQANRGKTDRDADRRNRQVVTLISSVGFLQRASETAYPWWQKGEWPEVVFE